MESGTANGSGDGAHARAGLVRLKINELPERNVDPCELRFSDTFNVLLGLNATGKTTLLEIIAAAMSFNFSKLAEKPFDIEYELRLRGGAIVAKVQNARSKSDPLPTIPGRQGGDALVYSAKLRVSLDSPRYEWQIEASANALQVQGAQGAQMRTRPPSSPPAAASDRSVLKMPCDADLMGKGVSSPGT
jgi:hypothetical protein